MKDAPNITTSELRWKTSKIFSVITYIAIALGAIFSFHNGEVDKAILFVLLLILLEVVALNPRNHQS